MVSLVVKDFGDIVRKWKKRLSVEHIIWVFCRFSMYRYGAVKRYGVFITYSL